MEKVNGRVYLYLVLTFFLWGSVYVASKYAMGALPAAAVTGFRFGVALIPLLLAGWKKLKATPIAREDWKYLIAVGALGYFLTPFSNMLGLDLVSASTGALINSLNPVGITIMAAIILKERIGPKHILCLLLVISGAVIITRDAGGEGKALGVMLIILSVACWGFCSATMRRINRKYGSLVITLYGIMISMAFHIPAIIISMAGQEAARVGWGTAAAIVYMGVFATALAQYLWGKSLSMLEAGRCGMFYPLQALFSSILSALLLDESFRPAFFLGAALIAAGVVLNCMEGKMEGKEKGAA